MMTHAYDKSYVNDFMCTFAESVDYAANDCKISIDDFLLWFINSGIAQQIEYGNPKFLAGMSGIEMAREVISRTMDKFDFVERNFHSNRTVEYWSGWVFSYYQWYRNIGFEQLYRRGLTLSFICSRYILHEADISKAVEVCDEKIEFNKSSRLLAYYRGLTGMTQKELAEKSNIPLRMIQLYEQGKNDISKANVSYVVALADSLNCEVTDLVGGK